MILKFQIMKKIILILVFFTSIMSYSQEHFAGLNTSNRVGVISVSNNPAELVNMSNRIEIGIFSISANVSNNKISLKDALSNDDLEDKIFEGDTPVNLKVDGEVYGPSFGIKLKKLAFAITTKVTGRVDVVDIDPNLGSALTNSNISTLLTSTTISNKYNQRFSGTTWGEIGISGAANIINTAKHKFNVGATIKLLFPDSYSNLGLGKFNGTITNSAGELYLNNVSNVNLNIAYSATVAEDFTNINDFTKTFTGNLNGFAGDIGINYQWRDQPEQNPKKNKNKYKLNTGITIRNMGSMTFKNGNNFSNNYVLNIQSTAENPQGLNLSLFENVESLQTVETILIAEGYLDKTVAKKSDFIVKLPTTFSAYADVKIFSKLFVTGYLQRRLNETSGNSQITAQNLITITPRFTTGFLEVFVPITSNEISGLNTGFGFRLGGFFIGSSSAITALTNDSKQVDIYTGFRWGFL